MDFPVNVKIYPILGMTKACEGVNTVNNTGLWKIQDLKKEGARLHETLKLSDFSLSFAINKILNFRKGEGRLRPLPSKSATAIERSRLIYVFTTET